MTVKVHNRNPHKLDIPVSLLLDGKNGRILRPILAELKRRKIQSTSTKHYRNALSQLRIIFRSAGVMSGIGGGAQTVPFKDGEGRGHTMRTTQWAPLTQRYAARRPVSRRYWKKRTQNSLASYYDADVKTKAHKAKVAKTKIEPPRRGNRVRIHYLVNFTKLPNDVVNTLIALPFVVGRESPARGFKAYKLNRYSSELMGYPEKAQRLGRKGGTSARPVNRPFVARLSSRLGQNMHTAIRKL